MGDQWVVQMISSCGKHYYLCSDPTKPIRQQPFEGYYQPLEGIVDRFTKFDSLETTEAFIKEYGGPWSGGRMLALPFMQAKNNIDLLIEERRSVEAQDALHKEDMKLNPELFEITESGGVQHIRRRYKLNVPNE